MRLHTLTVRAFGPFAGQEHVDFDRLTAGGLFLVHGPTGAGKTSILDAVCFALYGRVPGARHNDRSPKSDHAPLQREPEVTLEFTCGGRRLHIARRPRWERPKKRGRGTRVENSKVVVTERVEGSWVGVTTRPDEAGQFVGDLVGLTLEQFCQVAMLPQGDFARFLRARSEERRESLERIFNTRVFRDVEDWFRGHAAKVRREVETTEERVRDAAGRLAEAARSEAPQEPSELSPWAAEAASVAAATAHDAETVTAQVVQEREQARADLEHGRAVRDRHDRLATARRREAELREHAGERASTGARLAADERAGTVLPALHARDQRRATAEKAEADLAEWLSLVDGLPGLDRAALSGPADGAWPDAGAPPPQKALRSAEQERRDEYARLELLRGDVERLRDRDREVAGYDSELLRLARDLESVREQLSALPSRVETLTRELAEARDRSARAEGAEAARDAAQARLSAAREQERLSDELAGAEERRRVAVDAAQEARDRAQRLRERRIGHMAAELAAGLREGEPCTVCGSAEHPSPAAAGAEGVVSAEEEESANAAADAAAGRRSEAENAVVLLQERCTAAAERAEGRGSAEARAEVEARTWELSEARAAADTVQRSEEALERAVADLERARERESASARRESEVVGAREGAVAEQERLTRVLDTARGDDPTIEARAERMLSEADRLGAAADAATSRDRAAEELRDAEAEVVHRLAEVDLFADGAGQAEAWHGAVGPGGPGATEEQVRAAALSDSERHVLRERARSHDDEVAAVRAVLNDPELTGAGPVPDLEALADAAARAGRAADDAVAWRGGLRDRARRLAELRVELDACLAGSEPVLHRYAVADNMRALTSGTAADNEDHVRLSAYVLAARLEQVVAAANDRLATMSDGRYELRYTVDKAAGDGRARSAGGLGMRVLDAWTGVERDPATLSGGESFFSSLALALGLGDVAGAEAGGADIDTLFVDEGFGTLDEDTLEEVLEVLDGLRDGGRAVGVVSHVADLRDRVTSQLRVHKGSSGSRVEHLG
ncbi:nuclease SbcCD subunit C [Nocardiopsis kunsanensis]|uniref:Nuclease SbcCD subunit C n=1 Tax=Nocardiopsis kunsanensis TaxID=141693 RepID=A0A918X5K6_9ACTN|nr:SMC family ATPase [Nocardiopsis kunsanensis]GHD14230.1 nuclease SbcCD subunit C [Nocardiopsis kunsanensis]